MRVQYPLLTEKAVSIIDKENKITFIVDRNATREEVKKEVEDRFGVKVDKINMMITPKSQKKAVVRLAKEYSAQDLATHLNII